MERKKDRLLRRILQVGFNSTSAWCVLSRNPRGLAVPRCGRSASAPASEWASEHLLSILNGFPSSWGSVQITRTCFSVRTSLEALQTQGALSWTLEKVPGRGERVAFNDSQGRCRRLNGGLMETARGGSGGKSEACAPVSLQAFRSCSATQAQGC